MENSFEPWAFKDKCENNFPMFWNNWSCRLEMILFRSWRCWRWWCSGSPWCSWSNIPSCWDRGWSGWLREYCCFQVTRMEQSWCNCPDDEDSRTSWCSRWVRGQRQRWHRIPVRRRLGRSGNSCVGWSWCFRRGWQAWSTGSWWRSTALAWSGCRVAWMMQRSD